MSGPSSVEHALDQLDRLISAARAAASRDEAIDLTPLVTLTEDVCRQATVLPAPENRKIGRRLAAIVDDIEFLARLVDERRQELSRRLAALKGVDGDGPADDSAG
jgi:hypothetical protein